ncbi:MAG: histidinol phosphate phosphatase [Candidatus Tectomicrobia bacterium]|uniref:Histidinol phosphate phosphatase n=1 Tax=Tectimicrobiota bacterium TaxID=2528274 RepID=A0A937W0E8_UNCTE|nr:histidinol phosphate phosphatase [Candidatus Tectomicrobia bacterium]
MLQQYLDVAIAAAHAAGEVIRPYFQTALQVETKADATPVTAADRAGERVIVDMLRQHFPEHGVLGEEFGAQAGRGDARWIIDPIDGTQNFIRGIPFFGTLIALEQAGEITVGVAYEPVQGNLFHAAKGLGAFGNGERLAVSTLTELSQITLLHGSLDLLLRDGYWEGLARLARATRRQRGYGDYFAYTFVCRGQADVMLETDVKPWDIAPLKILVEEAGGRFSDFTGAPSIYSGNALISNGYVHGAVLALLDAQAGG